MAVMLSAATMLQAQKIDARLTSLLPSYGLWAWR